MDLRRRAAWEVLGDRVRAGSLVAGQGAQGAQVGQEVPGVQTVVVSGPGRGGLEVRSEGPAALADRGALRASWTGAQPGALKEARLEVQSVDRTAVRREAPREVPKEAPNEGRSAVLKAVQLEGLTAARMGAPPEDRPGGRACRRGLPGALAVAREAVFQQGRVSGAHQAACPGGAETGRRGEAWGGPASEALTAVLQGCSKEAEEPAHPALENLVLLVYLELMGAGLLQEYEDQALVDLVVVAVNLALVGPGEEKGLTVGVLAEV